MDFTVWHCVPTCASTWRTDMLIRYTRARASERAAAEARRLDLGNL
jgi:hypothetical protein